MHYWLIHQPTQTRVAQLDRADHWWTSGLGVMGWAEMPPGHALWLPGAASVHTCFVRFSLDLLFLTKEHQTLKIAANIAPWTPWIGARGASHTIELAGGTLQAAVPKAQIGDQWEILPISGNNAV